MLATPASAPYVSYVSPALTPGRELAAGLAGQAAPIVLPFELAANHVLVRARVNGVAGWLIVDTGSSLTALDTEWAKSIGARPAQQAQVLGTGNVTTTLATVDSVQLPGVDMRNLAAVLVPLDAVSRVHGRAIRGTLGYDFLSCYAVEIDYARRELRLHDPATYEYARAGVVVPVSLQHRVPVVHATVTPAGRAPIAARLLLDLGTSLFVALLNTPFVEEHRLADGTLPAVDAPLGTGVGGRVLGRVTRLRELRLGDLAVSEPTVGLGRERVGFVGSTFVDGTVGAPLFERTTMILDYARARVIFEPGPRFATPYEYDMSGLQLGAGDHGAALVTFVVAGGPAQVAGVQVGDEVVAVDGRGAGELSLEAIRGALRIAGARPELTIRRGGSERRVRLTLRRLV